MIKKLNYNGMNKITDLFKDWKETLIWSCLQGHMGSAWVDDIENPKSVQVITADFCFFSGVPNVELVKNIPKCYKNSCILMVPENDLWGNIIEEIYKDKFEKFYRYAIKKEKDIFNRNKLNSFIDSIPEEYQIIKIDETIYNKANEEEWSRDLCSQFKSYEDFEKRGLGFVVSYNGELISGASSYTVYNGGIEIEIDTKREFRRRGLALACASKLILECLDRGLYPSWDAANKASVALSEKLGYHFDKEYITYEVILK